MKHKVTLQDIIEQPIVADLLNSLGEGLVIADREGQVIYLNAQAENILSIPFASIKGRGIAGCHACPWKVSEALASSTPSSPYRAEIPVRGRWLSITATPLIDSIGVTVGSIMVARDTTDRHLLEAELKKTNAELEERHAGLAMQIELARSIQKSLMPEESVLIPGARVRVWNVQSQIVGGDVMFVQKAADGGWLILADIMGKGLFASQFVPLIHEYLHEETAAADSPAVLLSRLDKRLKEFINERFTLFITMVCLRWEFPHSKLVCASAGHESPFLVSSEGKVSTLPVQGPPLGITTPETWIDHEIELEPGDKLLCFTDGVKEAAHDFEENKDTEWLKNIVTELAAGQGDLFLKLVEYVKSQAIERKAQDDQSLMILEV